MPYQEVNIGKYREKGKTIPQIVFDDLDWFCEAIEKRYFSGRLLNEAELIYRKIQNIKIPNKDSGEYAVEYHFFDSDGGFCDFQILPKNKSDYRAIKKIELIYQLEKKYMINLEEKVK
ncbi:MAG: hypothetical protein HPY53_07585 [Brevinematales bacterium]|nr:hypothetical protein [Brevinematales bacterium]